MSPDDRFDIPNFHDIMPSMIKAIGLTTEWDLVIEHFYNKKNRIPIGDPVFLFDRLSGPLSSSFRPLLRVA